MQTASPSRAFRSRSLDSLALCRVCVLVICTSIVVGGSRDWPSPAHAIADELDELRLPEPTRPHLLSLLADGRAAEALEALDAELAPLAPDAWPIDALVLRARLLEAAGRPQEVANAWTAVGGVEAGLADHAGRASVKALLQAGRPALAEGLLERLSDGRPALANPDLVIEVARGFLAAGDAASSAAGFEAVLAAAGERSELADRARLGLAEAREAAGDVRSAIATLHRARLHHHASETYLEAWARERRLTGATGTTPLRFGPREYLDVAERLAGASRFAEAVTLLEEALTVHGSRLPADEVEHAIVDSLYAGRQNDAAMARAERFVERFASSRRVPAMKLTQFRLAVRVGRTEEVRARGYELWRGRVAGASPGQRRSAGLLLAAYLVAVGDVTSGLAVYRELYRVSGTTSQRRDILWRAGVAALRDGQLDRAAVNLRALLRLRPGAQVRELGMYWLARVEARLGNETAAAGLLLDLVDIAPYSYYGVQAVDAYTRLVGAQEPPEAVRQRLAPRQSFPDLSLGDAVREHPLYRAASALARAGADDAAAEHVRRLSNARRRDAALGLVAARAAARANQHHHALRLADRHFGRYLRRPTDDAPSDLLALAYPRAFWTEVQRAAARDGVDPLLLLAIMRQESLFEAPVRSRAGAVGLFQMMSYTAEALADSLGIPPPSEEDLKQPAVSASLGARLVSNLLRMFDGHAAPVAASYNAGEDRAVIWWRAAEGLSEPMFVDSIPYAETRNYVRRVLANLARYRAIHGTDASRLAARRP